MKKVISLAVVVAMVLSVTAIPVFASPATADFSITIDQVASEVEVGDSIFATIALKNCSISGLVGFNFRLEWDTTKLVPAHRTTGVPLTGGNANNAVSTTLPVYDGDEGTGIFTWLGRSYNYAGGTYMAAMIMDPDQEEATRIPGWVFPGTDVDLYTIRFQVLATGDTGLAVSPAVAGDFACEIQLGSDDMADVTNNTGNIILGPVPDIEITSVETVDPITVAKGTEFTAIGLPATLEGIYDGGAVDLAVEWAAGSYDKNTVGVAQTINGTLTIPDGHNLSGGLTDAVTATVTVKNEITGIDDYNDVVNTFDYGTAFSVIEAAVGSFVGLYDGGTLGLDVEWDDADYDSQSTAGQTIGGLLSIPQASENTFMFAGGFDPAVSITVTLQKIEIKSLNAPAVDPVPYGTPFAGLGLPATISGIDEYDNPVPGIGVVWKASDYDANVPATYPIGTTSVTPPAGYELKSGVSVTASVTVKKIQITSISFPAAIPVPIGTPAGEIPFPAAVNCVTDPSGHGIALDVDWGDTSEPAYEANTPGEYVFSGVAQIPVPDRTNYEFADGVSATSVTVTVGTKKITAITPYEKTVPYNSPLSALELPETLSVTVEGADQPILIAVVWDDESYDPVSIGEQVLTGVLTLGNEYELETPGLADDVTATITVSAPTIITAGDLVAVAKDVPYKTAAAELALPETVTAAFDDESEVEIPVEWDTQNYDATTPGEQEIAGTFGAVPSGYKLADGLTGTTAAVTVVAEIVSIADYVAEVPYNTEYDALELPETLTARYDAEDESKVVELSVLWEEESETDYSATGELNEEQTVNGTITQLPIGYQLGDTPAAVKALITLVENEISEIESYTGSVAYGTAFADLDLPETLAATCENGTVDLSVTWEKGEYDPAMSGAQTVTGTVDVPEGYVLAESLTEDVTATITVEAQPRRRRSSSSTTTTTPPATDTTTPPTDTTTPPTDATTPPTDTTTPPALTDVNDAGWAADYINALVEMNIMSGYDDGTFRPNAAITRAEFATIIVMASGGLDEDATGETSFGDVSSADWFAAYVAAAEERGFISGYGDGTFGPNDTISRADIAVIVYRYLTAKNPELKVALSGYTFKDDSQIPDYAQEAVYALNALGIISGMGDDLFAPAENATRAQVAKVLVLTLMLQQGLASLGN